MPHIEYGKSIERRAGFTTIETLMAMLLLSVFFSFSLGSLHSTRAKATLGDATDIVRRSLEEARIRAANGNGTGSQSVHIQHDRIVPFEGASFSGAGSEIFLPPLTYTDQASTTITFSRLTAMPNSPIDITITGTDSVTSTISVSASGLIEVR